MTGTVAGGVWQGLAPVALAVLLTLAVAVLVRRRSGSLRPVDGRARPGAPRAAGAARPGDARALVLGPDDVGRPLGSRLTFVQLSAEVCSACRSTARVLTGVAAHEHGVVHVELDVAEHPGLVRRLGVLRTPTVLVLDAAGAVVERSSGALGPAEATAAVARVGAAPAPPG